MYNFVTLLLILGLHHHTEAQSKGWSDQEETTQYWNDMAQNTLKVALEKELPNKNVARNVILFLGDGMGMSTVTAGRILKGQMHNQSGEEYQLAMEKFPHIALSKVYALDKQTPDSAATATAYLSGVKSKDGTIGLDGRVIRGNCASSRGSEVKSILEESYEQGKSVGIVTTTHLFHASPSGVYAHTADREWVSDVMLPNEAKENGCKDIAQQFFDSLHMITVALGGGREYATPNTTTDPEYPILSGGRKDGQNLIEKWKKNGKTGEKRNYVWNKDQFDAIDPVTTHRLLGMFERSHMQYEADRASDTGGEPSIAEMTEKAIQILRKNSNGYFLFVEGGRIDHGHHATVAYSAMHDMVAFDDAVEKAAEMTPESDTLIIVTADHGHMMGFGGYADRGSSIFGLTPDLGMDMKPSTSILYANGPSYQGTNNTAFNVTSDNKSVTRENISDVDTEARNYHQQSAVPLQSETHSAEDVAIFAKGPMAHLFHGVHEQNYIAHVMRYALCIGSNQAHCNGKSTFTTTSTPDLAVVASFIGFDLSMREAEIALYVQLILVLCFALFIIILLILLLVQRRKFSNGLEFKRDNAYAM